MSHELTQILATAVSVFTSSAVISLVIFLIQRKDTQRKEAKTEQKENQNEKIESLRSEFNAGLQAREDTGFERYTEHKEAINMLTGIVDKNTETLSIIGESLIGLEHDKIIYLSDRIAKRKAITLREKSTLEALYVPYAKLGGNGDCKVAYNHCINLPVVTDAEAEEMDLAIKKKDLGL